MPITFKRAGQEAVTLENVSFKGVALDKVTFKRAGQEAVTVFEKAAEDALAGTWVFNENPDVSGSGTIDISINFTSNQRNFTKMTIIKGSIPSGSIQYGEYEVYNLMIGWDNEAYKTITISSKLSEVTNGEQLLTWLQANATKQ